MSTIVAGIDFGTQSVRVSLFDSVKGRLGAGSSEYPLHRTRDDPDFATQSHADHLSALVQAIKQALAVTGVDGRSVASLAIDTTASSVVPVGDNLEPLDDYYLWCDHRAWREAAAITETARASGLEAIQWCGGIYSSEWGFAKLLHWLRNASPEKRAQMVSAFEHCDLITAVLCGITHPADAPRSICAVGHKWMWNASLGGFPSDGFFARVDPLLAGIGAKLPGRYATSDKLAGRLCSHWAERLGLAAGIPIPVGAIDAHWDAVGAGIRLGDVINVVGTSTCMMAIGERALAIPGVCGVVQGSIHPRYAGIEAGLSATGDIFDAIARRASSSVTALSKSIEGYRAGQTGLLRLTWDNGDRTVLVNPELGGVTLGWKLTHSAEDELFAAIEGTAFHKRIILERMEQNGVPVKRIINGGGIPQKNDTLNRVYANVFNKPVLVPKDDATSLGAAIFAFVAAGAFPSIEAAQDALCSSYREFAPDPAEAAVCEEMYGLFREVYFSMGTRDAPPAKMGAVLPRLREIAGRQRKAG
jgi:L-ribulokinase